MTIENGTINRDKIEEAIVGEPLTVGYAPNLPILAVMDDHLPISAMVHDVEAMLRHPHVAMCLDYYKSAISSIKYDIEGSDPKVVDFAKQMFDLFWERSLSDVQIGYDYGWVGLEVLYKTENGRIIFDGTKIFSPLDVRVLTVRGRYVGVRVNNVKGKGVVDLWGPTFGPAKAYWYPHRRKYHQWYGRSQLYSAWRPWRRLASHDGAEQIIDTAVYRFGVRPLIVYYPPEDFQRAAGGSAYGDRVNARDMARQIGEWIKSNANVALPNAVLPNTEIRKWEIVWPEVGLNTASLLEYIKYLKDEIAYGIGIPPELIQASEVGSGYSGRAIPMEAFLAAQQENARTIAQFWVDQIGLPLVRWNFGRKKWFRLKVYGMLEAKIERVAIAMNRQNMIAQAIQALSAMASQEAAGPGGLSGNPGAPAGKGKGGGGASAAQDAMQQMLQGLQMSTAQWDESKHERAEKGKNITIGGKEYRPGEFVPKKKPGIGQSVHGISSAISESAQKLYGFLEEHVNEHWNTFQKTMKRAKKMLLSDSSGTDIEKARKTIKAHYRLGVRKLKQLESRYGRLGTCAIVGAFVAANIGWLIDPSTMAMIAPEPMAQCIGIAEAIKWSHNRMKRHMEKRKLRQKRKERQQEVQAKVESMKDSLAVDVGVA